MKQRTLFGIIIACLIALLPVLVQAGDLEANSTDETMLMLVGETEPLTTVASRQPESPAAAAAVVTVISREEIERNGYRTLAELLAGQPGFFMAMGGRGTAPYLRGLRDSILFLYDGAPVTTDVTKGFAPLDQEVSLVGVDHVEIVRGPGSVLWGPDAFAGVVNIVPVRGRQRSGGEGVVSAGQDGSYTGALTWGGRVGSAEAFLAASNGSSIFSPSEYTVRQADGAVTTNSVADSTASEVVSTVDYGDWLHVTGRWSDFNRHYTMRNASGNIVWPGEKEAPFILLKATASKIVGPSHYSLSGFIEQLDYRVQDADIERSQTNQVNHLEMLWDRRLFSRSLVTAGVSWQQNRVDGALVRDGFLPDYLVPDVPFFSPQIDQKDYVNELSSVFSQFRFQWGGAEWWVGGRLDDHTQYRSTVTYSLGVNRPVRDDLRVKAVYGNAFRSPYSGQLFGNAVFEPESIKTASAQLLWTPAARREVELTLFHSKLDSHIVEDPYGGLSLPAQRDYSGLELSGTAPLGRLFDLRSALSFVDANGEETYHVLRYTILRDDGSSVSVYENWNEPIDQGPGWQVSMACNWRVMPGHSLMLRGQKGGSVELSYDKGKKEQTSTMPLLLDLVYRFPGFLAERDGFTLKISNLLDSNYLLPDLYGPVEGPPLQATLEWRCVF